MPVEVRPAAPRLDSEPQVRAVVRASDRLPQIDVLRALACLYVVCHHSYKWLYFRPNPLPDEFFSHGYLGVNLFMVLSGFCLARPIMFRGGWEHGAPGFRSFMKRRAIRILPPYFAALFLFLVYGLIRDHAAKDSAWKWFIQDHTTVPGFISHLFMVHNFSSRWVGQVDWPMWSLALEFQFYAVFVLLALWFARFGLKWLVAGTFALSLVWEAIWVRVVGPDPFWTVGVTHQVMLPGALAAFVAGMAVAQLAADGAWMVQANRLKWVSVGLGAAVYMALTPRFAVGQNVAGAIAFGVLTLMLASVPARPFERSQVLRFLEWIGIFSYSIYLVHQPLINPVMRALYELTGSAVVMHWLLVPILVVVGYLFHLIFERPFMKLRPRPAASAL